MFKIYDRRNEFYQWDLNQKLIVDDITITQVHFCNKTNDCSLVCEVYELDGLRVVDVPNILLQYPKRINVYAYCSNYTKVEDVFRVIARTKPSDYIYTETEAKTFAALEARMANVEQNGVPQDVLNAAIGDYFNDNPIETGATAAQAAQIEENKKDIASMEKAAANYALKSELPSTEGLATEDYVDTAINNIELPSGGDKEWSLVFDKLYENVATIQDTIFDNDSLLNYEQLIFEFRMKDATADENITISTNTILGILIHYYDSFKPSAAYPSYFTQVHLRKVGERQANDMPTPQEHYAMTTYLSNGFELSSTAVGYRVPTKTGVNIATYRKNIMNEFRLGLSREVDEIGLKIYGCK